MWVLFYIIFLESIRKLANSIDEIYFTNYTSNRNDLLKSTIMEIMKLIDENLQNSNILNKTEISFLFFTKSLCLDKLPDYSKNAEKSASKSVKNTKFKNKIFFKNIINNFSIRLVETESF